MWGSKNRRIAELAEQRNEARAELAESRATVIRLAGRNDELSNRLERANEAANDGALDEMGARLDRALRACARYLDAYHAQCRVNDRLSDQLMGAMGYTDDGLKALGVALAKDARENGGVKQ
ncbi:hypothetical protein ACH4TQ_27380 [Streptomyces sp. NPDC021218]|uniref:hypothetical protein n=1 Tax=Streptomyces sp. NPDC021218 TaxID=3365119 RepID=UPI0037B29B15